MYYFVFSQKWVLSPPHSLKPRKSLHCFCCALLASLRHGNRGECLAVSASSAIVAEALLPPFSNDCTPRSGRGVVGAIAPTYWFDFCSAKMAESKDLDSARLALLRTLLFIFGKASHKVFWGGWICESVLDSVKWDFVFESLSLDSKSVGVDSIKTRFYNGLRIYKTRILDSVL